MGDSVIYPHMMQTKQAAQTFGISAMYLRKLCKQGKRKLGDYFGDEYLQHPQLAESLRSIRTKEIYKAYPDTVTTADNVTVYTKAAKEYVNNMPPAQLEANGHDVFEGQPRMIDALDTIEQLAKFDHAAAWKCYQDFMEKNLSGVSIEIKG